MNDEDQLNVLGMLFYLIAGFFGLMACFPLIYLAFGIAILSGGIPLDHQDKGLPIFVGWLLIGFSLFLIFLGAVYAFCNGLAGRCLQTRRWRTFCIVMAGLICLNFPFGTAFGIFTIYTLTRPSVTKLFEDRAKRVTGAPDQPVMSA